MNAPPPNEGSDGGGRLRRCIRDLAALQALPSMCVGRSPDEAFEIIVDALPTVLDCDLVYLALGESDPRERLFLRGAEASAEALGALRVLVAAGPDDGLLPVSLPQLGEAHLLIVEAPLGAKRVHLVAGRRRPLDPETDRVLVRIAANVVGTTLETANVLEAARRKDEFLAMLGHELRNPLAPIATAVELLGRVPAAAREREVLERHTRHLARLVDDLLDISRVTRGHIELRKERTPLATAISGGIEIASALLARQRHRLHVESAEGIAVEGDPVRLAQVFGNLLTNAAKFTPSPGDIQVLVRRLPHRVEVTVRDDGRGIAQPQLRRIFEPFVQGEQGDALRGGLGLGLAIVSRLVEQHGGTIRATSDGVGKGAAFTVALPTTEGAPAAAEPPTPQPPSRRAGVRVLLVDDDVDIAELLSEALEREGFETAIAYDAAGALQRWRTFAPHAAILDVGLPDRDGYELARAVRDEHGAAPTLIAATGYGQERDRVRAGRAGFDCHFVKPVSVHALVHVLDERVVGARRSA